MNKRCLLVQLVFIALILFVSVLPTIAYAGPEPVQNQAGVRNFGESIGYSNGPYDCFWLIECEDSQYQYRFRTAP